MRCAFVLAINVFYLVEIALSTLLLQWKLERRKWHLNPCVVVGREADGLAKPLQSRQPKAPPKHPFMTAYSIQPRATGQARIEPRISTLS